MVKKRIRGRPREFDLNEALDKAVEVFWELGYEAADTATLSARMGLSKPSIYNSFGSKEDLFLEALQRYQETVSKKSVKALMDAQTLQEGLYDYFAVTAQAVSGQGQPSGCMFICVAIPVSKLLPKVGTVVEESLKIGQERMAAYFESHIEKAALPSTFNISAAVSLMQDLFIAMATQGRLGASFEELERYAARNAKLIMLEGNRSTPQ